MPVCVSALLLAAGSSTRMGRLKQTLPLSNKPAIRHCLDNIMASGVENTVVVLGPQAKEISGLIDGLPINIVVNNNYNSEMAESVRTGLRAVDKSSTGVLICLSDHPLVSVDTLRMLVNMHIEQPGKIIIPLHNGKRGHPSLFPVNVLRELFDGLNLREVINKSPEKIVLADVVDEGVILDMDTMEDYRKMCEIINGKNA